MPLVISNTYPLIAVKYFAIFAFVAFCIFIKNQVSLKVKHPFIDEIFHLRQCYTYCNYQFDKWDNKITTPPGLYFLGFGYVKVLEYITGIKSLCDDYNVLRSLNLVGGLIVFPIALHRLKGAYTNQYWSINIISQPLLFTYYFLFYTDVWSAVLVVLSLALAKNHQPWGSAIVGFVSLWFRQTNIVWIAFILAVYIDGKIQRGEYSFIGRVIKFVTTAVSNFFSIIPLLVNFVLFAVFLKMNGGITFGDKDNHKVGIHLVQVFYCFTFINFFTWPVWMNRKVLINYGLFIVGSHPLHQILNAASMFGIKFIIDKFTIVHPFLLADNRHFTFYIFKKLISHKYSQVITIPLYHFATYNIISSLLRTKRMRLSPIGIIAFLVSVCLTIVPSPLFEPRYYIVPLILFRVYITPVHTWSHALEFIWLNSINVLMMLVFFKYEFSWDSEPGSIQRIIW
ncbi:ALG10 [[Candida] subhashii]|uniref:Dol-P-Glc:Glc(2)Man(9)GlcNAc(2)-PP-Dol alpha-1,2-glucosyltransferase n=1 Tax=[Candida] subhashii TaxID=561895 RepID=A0A8J5QVP7_9ASCO|nr:ALG10 [[Candida] subhashii]KAG7663085.1 ALG10 [[Candida] subhashii]